MKKYFFTAAVISTLVLAGCNSLPNNVKDMGAYESGSSISNDLMTRIQDKTTTQKEVIALVGYPTRKEQNGTKESWYYDFSKISHFGSNVSESTVFEFDAKGVLITHYKTNKGAASGNPLLKAAGM
jgi:outer membrane protein assembly factor BamE